MLEAFTHARSIQLVTAWGRCSSLINASGLWINASGLFNGLMLQVHGLMPHLRLMLPVHADFSFMLDRSLSPQPQTPNPKPKIQASCSMGRWVIPSGA
jgi:hypothetical protein